MRLLLLNSGGKDSLATVMLLRRTKGYVIHSLFVWLGHENEVRASSVARRVAQKFCDSHDEQHLPGLVPGSMKLGYVGVPHQAVLLHMYGAAYAASRDIHAMASGQNGPVEMREGIVGAFDAARSFRAPPLLMTPVWDLSPDQVFEVVRGEPLWRETVTCSREPACGACVKCKLRADWEGR